MINGEANILHTIIKVKTVAVSVIVVLLVLAVALPLSLGGEEDGETAALPTPAPTPTPEPVDNPPGEVKFGIVTDVHYADKDDPGRQRRRQAGQKLQDSVDGWNNWEADFVVELGDFIDGRWEGDEHLVLGELDYIEDVYDNVACPRYYVIGNHDLLGLYKSDFIAHTGCTAKWTSWTVKNRHFIILDDNWVNDSQEWGGSVSGRQGYIPLVERQWLEKDLAATPYKTIVFVHHQLYYVEGREIRNMEQVRQILEDSGKVVAVFHGHRHYNEMVKINDIRYLEVMCAVSDEYPTNAWAKVLWKENGDIYLYGQGNQWSYLPLEEPVPGEPP